MSRICQKQKTLYEEELDATGDLKGKVALVTGGGRGIGRETCILLASHGADVAISSRTASECEEVAAYIQKTYGTKTVVVTGDVSNEADVQQLFNQLKKSWGKFQF